MGGINVSGHEDDLDGSAQFILPMAAKMMQNSNSQLLLLVEQAMATVRAVYDRPYEIAEDCFYYSESASDGS